MSRLRVLGSGDAFNSGGALHSCYLLEGPQENMMIECGPSVLAGLKRQSIATDSFDTVLISHLHGDHFGGLAYLLLEYVFKSPRTKPFVLAGPPGLEERAHDVYKALYSEKIFHQLCFEVRCVDIHPGDELELVGNKVKAFEVPHSAEPFSLGFRIETPDGGSMVFSGDSAWTPEFIDQTRGCDLFLCECCSMKPMAPVHTSYEDLINHRDELDCRRVVLTHVGSDVREAESLDFDCAEDGMVIELAGG